MSQIKKNKVYVVHAVRFSESHSYVVGVYTTKTKAMKRADLESEHRGRKYSLHVYEISLNQTGPEKQMKQIYHLDSFMVDWSAIEDSTTEGKQ